MVNTSQHVIGLKMFTLGFTFEEPCFCLYGHHVCMCCDALHCHYVCACVRPCMCACVHVCDVLAAVDFIIFVASKGYPMAVCVCLCVSVCQV